MYIKFASFKYLLYVVFLLLINSYSSAKTIKLTKDFNQLNYFGQYIEILEDTSGKLDFDEIRNSSKDFNLSDQKLINLNISKSTFWAKFSIENNSNNNHLLLTLTYPIIDSVTLYSVNSEGLIDVDFNGESVPFSKRKYKNQNFIFDLNIPKNTTSTFYLKLRSDEQIMLPIKIGKVKNILQSSATLDLYNGVYFGIIIVMLLYNFFVFLSVRDVSYLYYVLYILLVGLVQASDGGYSYRLFWPEHPFIANATVTIFPSLVGVSAILFMRNFLNTRRYLGKLDNVFFAHISIYALCILLFISGYTRIAYPLTQANALLTSITMIIMAIIIIKRGSRPAKFFLVAWSVFLVSVILFVMKDLGVLPYNNFTKHILKIGSSIELILLSFALADRINILKQEKEEAQDRELGLLQENQEIIEQQNIVLEQKVKERTQELEESNFDLNKAIIDLKLAQSQLVDAEKMASLGQLTAGIAHEINNPINFVVANINPLKRDINDIIEVLEKYAEIKNGDNVAEKLNEIEELKEDLDLEFTLEEIEQLLKGMDEGASRTVEIVKSLRTFSRLDEDGLKTANINECLDSTLMLLKNSLKEGIEIEKSYTENTEIECYPGKMNQLFMNILNNAVHAVGEKMDANKTKGFIKLVTEMHDNELIIKIKDNGIGMDEEVKKKIFDPFFTTKDIGEGTGLGLSIVHSIIEKHNAKIEVNSEIGEGTEFVIHLPKKINAAT